RDQFREKFSPLADYLAFQDYLDLTGRDESSSMVGPKGKMSGKSVFRCPDPLTRLAVHADGGLFPCCSDFGRLAPVGDLWRDGLAKAWNSGAALFLASREGRGSSSCQRCLRASGLIGSSGEIPNEPGNGPKGTFPAAAGTPPPLPLAAIMAAPGDDADFPGQSAWRPASEFSGN
ncbi:MAG: SPASM domain-containing protein, partial [Deltaproteobacteria bacterium]|nr:SPASM domain-containing protein [Deltaproteobacteria bacterium]